MTQVAMMQIPLHQKRVDTGPVCARATGDLGNVTCDVQVTETGVYVRRHADGLSVGVDLVDLCRKMVAAMPRIGGQS